MDIIIFIAGFVLGAIAVYVPLFLGKKNERNTTDAILEQMKLYFENTANKVVQESSSSLNEQNKEKLEEFFKRFKEKIDDFEKRTEESSSNRIEQNKEKLEEFFKRFKEKIEDFEKRTEENFKVETEKFTRFDMNIKSFIEAGNKISSNTSNLVNVMKSDNKTSGRWGEIVLERVLEASGLRRGEEFEIQKGTAEGRPDAVVNLPEGRCIFIDSKTSFASWYGYVNAETEDEKAVHLRQFVDSTKAHITGLAKRDYSAEGASPDYVLMFIPIEGCYAMMFCDDCALWDYAWKNKVMPVSPSTLLAALKIINAFHQIDKQNKNVIEMARLCAGVHDKFAALLTDLLKIRDNLNNTLKKLQGSGNIITQIGKIEKLGGAVTKEIPEIPEDLE